MKIIMRMGEIFMCILVAAAIGIIWYADILVIRKIFMSILYTAIAGLFVLFTETIISEVS